MYMTGTDGVAVSSYAFDDFGRNIDPRTGKQRKHEYITNGNIIQPFAFTGYQEDEISGLKFAQARFYDANTGRFQSEDNVKGFIDNPFTLNHYGYCWGNPVGLVDNDGNWPTVIIGAAIGGAVGFVGDVVTQVASGKSLTEVDYKQAGKTAIKGAVTGAVIGTGVGAVALATGCSTAAAVGTVGIAAGVGAVQGGLGAAATGGNVLNGSLSGAINATVSLTTVAFFGENPMNQYTAQFAGGFAGNLASDLFDNIDKPGTYGKRKMFYRALAAGGIQATISGLPAYGSQISGMNEIGSNFVGLIFGFGSTFTQAAVNKFFPEDNIYAEENCGEH